MIQPISDDGVADLWSLLNETCGDPLVSGPSSPAMAEGGKGDRRAPGSMAGSLAKSEASEPRRATLVIYLGPLKPEHRHWPAVQTFPIELVRQAVDEMEKEKREGKVRLDEMD